MARTTHLGACPLDCPDTCVWELTVEDGNHRIEGLRRAGHSEYWSVVGFEDDRDRQRFLDER